MRRTMKGSLRVVGVLLVCPLIMGQLCAPSENHPPVANAVAVSSTVPSGGSGALNGSGSTDPDNDSLSYSWTVITGTATLTNPTSAVAGFTAPVTTTNLTLVFQLTVSDGHLSSTATATVTVTGSGGPGPTPILYVADQVVSISAGGGAGSVTFAATSGETIRITLTAAQTSMEPYGFLQAPDASGIYVPPLASAVNGSNTAQATLAQTGTYTLVIYDGTNQGGNVTVRVERL